VAVVPKPSLKAVKEINWEGRAAARPGTVTHTGRGGTASSQMRSLRRSEFFPVVQGGR